MIHVFLLVVLVNAEEVSRDMYFVDLNRCKYFASSIVGSKRRNTGYQPPSVKIEAYCIPTQIDPEDKTIKLYKERQG